MDRVERGADRRVGPHHGNGFTAVFPCRRESQRRGRRSERGDRRVRSDLVAPGPEVDEKAIIGACLDAGLTRADGERVAARLREQDRRSPVQEGPK